jgi:predicted nucleic acid-binding protein
MLFVSPSPTRTRIYRQYNFPVSDFMKIASVVLALLRITHGETNKPNSTAFNLDGEERDKDTPSYMPTTLITSFKYRPPPPKKKSGR